MIEHFFEKSKKKILIEYIQEKNTIFAELF